MSARYEVTKKHAVAYAAVNKNRYERHSLAEPTDLLHCWHGRILLGMPFNITEPAKPLADQFRQHRGEGEGITATAMHLNSKQPLFTKEKKDVLKQKKNQHTMPFLPHPTVAEHHR